MEELIDRFLKFLSQLDGVLFVVVMTFLALAAAILVVAIMSSM